MMRTKLYRYTYSARIGENARGNPHPRIFPDSKPHPYIDFMSSQCTVIVYISLRNFVGEAIIRLHKLYNQISRLNWSELEKNQYDQWTKIIRN